MDDDPLIGSDALNMLAEVLDLPLGNQRVVIDIPCNGIARVIIQNVATRGQIAAIAKSLKCVGFEAIGTEGTSDDK